MTSAAKGRCNQFVDGLGAAFLSTGDAAPVFVRRTEYVDTVVGEAYRQTLAELFPTGLALLAVGGYGRGELFPHSDIDLLLLTGTNVATPQSKAAISEFVRRIWDAGLRCSQSVRPMEECCSLIDGNLELTISLLDQRLLTGDATLHARFVERLDRFLNVERKTILKRLCQATRERHAKFHSTIYRLEPDVKDAPGGLRDLHAIRWLSRLRNANAPELPSDALRLLMTVRAFLHFRAGRDHNLLDFESQDALAAAAFSQWNDPSAWMRAWYRNASAIWLEIQSELEAAESSERSMLASFRDWRSRLSNSEFTVSRELVFLRNPHELARDEALPLRLFEFLARHKLAPARQTERRIAEHAEGCAAAYEKSPMRARWWRAFLALSSPVTALRSMRACGFLTALLPEWAAIEHLVVRDFYHHYTVDEHTFVTLESVEDLAHANEGTMARFAEILDECRTDVWMLLFALLMHDIGKGTGGDHESKSVRIAERVLARAGFAEDECATILFLVAHHIDLSSMMQTRDLSDPATARHAASIVKTSERLRLLTVMTLADINAVNPKALTPWRLEQLWRLYRITQRELNRGLGEEAEAPAIDVSNNAELAEFVAGLPKRYLYTHTEAQAAAQAELYTVAKSTGAALRIERGEGFFRLVVVAADRPFLFASIAGGLSSFQLNILKAEAFHNRHGYIADSFVFSDPHRNLELNPSEIDRLHERLMRIVRGDATAEQFLRSQIAPTAPTRTSMVTPSVTLDSDTSETATVFEVVAQDRAGLLHALAAAISRTECNIEVVLVNTEAHRAIDVFHVTHLGYKLDDERAELLRAALLTAAVGDVPLK